MNRELTREEAIRLHRKMWGDMQAELGDDPPYHERVTFKKKWVEKYFPNEHVNSDCFLCEYAQSVVADSFTRCRACPIAWNSDILPNCRSEVDYRYSPISVILALPERGGDGMSEELKSCPFRIHGERRESLTVAGEFFYNETFMPCMGKECACFKEDSVDAYCDRNGTFMTMTKEVTE